ncbi:LytR C-terminal domain-containing protein [Nocardia sp. NPDC127526]|uniref:LytR C-terminal domain-containing protein n=1 Tax=Nocardia sp. NPDC127526 TaxID=3345393 RepID=UPI00362895C3
MSNPNSPSGGPPLRALAMVLIALAIVFAGIGTMSLSSSDSEGAETDTAAVSSTVPGVTLAPGLSSSLPPVVVTPPVTTTPPVSTAPPTTTAAAQADKSVPVRVYNNSTVAGLAAKTAGELSASGWTIAETGNYAAGVIPKTTVYYGSSASEKAAALAIAEELGVSAEPRFPGIADSPAGVIVIVTGN